MKGKQRSLNGLFWRYLLSTMALLAGVLLALWFVQIGRASCRERV